MIFFSFQIEYVLYINCKCDKFDILINVAIVTCFWASFGTKEKKIGPKFSTGFFSEFNPLRSPIDAAGSYVNFILKALLSTIKLC